MCMYLYVHFLLPAFIVHQFVFVFEVVEFLYILNNDHSINSQIRDAQIFSGDTRQLYVHLLTCNWNFATLFFTAI